MDIGPRPADGHPWALIAFTANASHYTVGACGFFS